tara:strand:+ start:273 stop:500 length:228 start_codon:yes stop_codon:yes gene_type:complete
MLVLKKIVVVHRLPGPGMDKPWVGIMILMMLIVVPMKRVIIIVIPLHYRLLIVVVTAGRNLITMVTIGVGQIVHP